MTPAKLAFGIGERVAMRVKFADIVKGKFSQEVRLRGDVGGERRTIYLGPTSEAITSLHAGGALATLDIPALPPGVEAVEFPLAHKELVLERVAVPGTRRSRLVVTTNGNGGAAHAAEPPRGTTVTPGPAAPPLAPVSDIIEAKRAALVDRFAEALTVTFRQLAPIFTTHGQTVDADIVYRVAFALWKSWVDAGLA